MLIGILQAGQLPDQLRDTTPDYPEMFEALLEGNGFTFKSWLVEEMEFPDAVTDADGWLITGSKHGAYSPLPFIAKLEDFIRKAYARHVPMAGICFGHQVIATALGGTVEKFSEGWSVGPQPYDFSGETLVLNAWHQDQIVALPADATVWASSEFCKYAGLRYGDRAISVQAHPEYGDAFIKGLINFRGRGVVPDDRLDTAERSFGQPLAAKRIADDLALFFKSAPTTRIAV
jgi:GMP synthase-like glutamine amidotransferase